MKVEKNIKMLQLVTGDVIIGNVVEEDNNLNIEKPLQVMVDPMQGVGMVPYLTMFTNKEMNNVVISKDKVVVYIEEYDEVFTVKYLEHLTGVITPANNIEV